MKRIGKHLIFALIAVFPLLTFAAEDVKVYSSVERKEVGQGEGFVFSITVSSKGSVNVADPRLPKVTDFDLLNTWTGTESRSLFTNGKFTVEQSRVFNYMLAANQSGRIEIGSVEVVVDGKPYKTEPIIMTVNPTSGAPGAGAQQRLAQRGQQQQQPQARRAQPQAGDEEDPMADMEDLFNELLKRRGIPNPRGGAGGGGGTAINPQEAFQIALEVDKHKVYAGEQVTANFYLYTRGQIRDIDTLQYPSLKGFWKEEIELATRLDFENHVMNGLVYKRALLASFALFPIKDGKAVIDPYKAKCTVITADNFGFGRPYVFTKASAPVTIDVLPLPKEGQPADFSGAVGQFRMAASLEQQTVAANQPVTLKIRVAGRGNAKLIELPPLNLPPSMEVYDTKKDSKYFKDGQSYKEFEVLLIPREPGLITIPAVSISAFDPITKKYYTQKSTDFKLQVTPAMGVENDMKRMAQGPKVDEKAAPVDVIPGLILGSSEASFVEKIPTPAWAGVYALIFAALGFQAWTALRPGATKKDLRKILKDRIAKLKGFAAAGDFRKVGIEGTNLFYLILGEVSGLGGSSFEFDRVLLNAPPSVRRDLGEKLKKMLTELEVLGFAPEEVLAQRKEKKDLIVLIDRLEDLLNQCAKAVWTEETRRVTT